jgi:hypothetical protein
MHIECYSQRLLNPFRGVMNVIRYQSAEAVTTDGVHWEIYVSNDELRDGLDPRVYVQISDIRYGHWSREGGLKRGPIYPSEDFKRMETMGAVVYEALLQYHEQLPFPLQDRYELWLLDRDRQPLCLLHSVVDETDMSQDVPLQWRAGNLCAELFQPQCLPAENAAAILTQQINELGADPVAVQWYLRQPEGQALPLRGDDAGNTSTPQQFPQFFLREHHSDPELTALVREYLQWQAPWLLLLQDLSSSVRFDLEQSARSQALLVEQHFRLYPEIIDESFLRAARVEAMLRKSQPQEEKQDKSMSTWYLELGDWSRGK